MLRPCCVQDSFAHMLLEETPNFRAHNYTPTTVLTVHRIGRTFFLFFSLLFSGGWGRKTKNKA